MRKLLLLLVISLWVPASRAQAQVPVQPKDYTAHVVGSAHIDMAWLWHWEESNHDVMYNTFSNQLKLMDQYPDFAFAQDRAIVYEMMEQYYPEIYKGILRTVKTRNWIPVSSTWVQI